MKNIFLLDLDDTLLDFPRAERKNFFTTAEESSIRAGEEHYGYFHDVNDALWKALERGEMDRETLKVLRFERLFQRFGFSADALKTAEAYYRNFEGIFFPFAGATEFLRVLSGRGSVYIVTNGGARIQRRHISDAGFAPFLTGAFISEEIGCNKPSQEFADYVRAHVKDFDARRALWLGDSLTSDLACAKKLGADFMLYAPHGAPEGYGGAVALSYDDVLRAL